MLKSDKVLLRRGEIREKLYWGGGEEGGSACNVVDCGVGVVGC